MKIRKTITRVFAMLLLCSAVQAASIQEPSTVFYGKVVGIGDVQPFAVYEGALVWTIRNASGSNSVFRTTLYKVNGGEFCYRLDIPHSAVAYELEAPDYGIPLPVVCHTNTHISALVNGVSAEFVGPGGSSFEAGQILRAQTLRLDLAVNLSAVDADGDGMPDWWEDLMGLDKQNPADANVDQDADGVLNLDEYIAGTDPAHDDREPSLVTDELLVFPERSTGLRVVSTDINNTPEELTYIVRQLPVNGKLMLRNASENPVSPDLRLSLNGEFTQADVNSGRLIFVHDDSYGVSDDTLGLALSDGVNTNAAVALSIKFYKAPEGPVLMSAAQNQRYRAYTATESMGVVIWDALRAFEKVDFAAPSSGLSPAEYESAYIPRFGDEVGQVMTGGRGDDSIAGGMADDVIVGGIGSDTLTGSGGADTFIFYEGDDASDIITDFNADEGDRIDLSGLLAARTGMMHESVKFQVSGQDTLIALNVGEEDSGFTSQMLKLAGVKINSIDGYQMVLDGCVYAGSLKLQPRISVAVTDPEASENGDNSGVFTFTREGDLSSASDVSILIAGTAVNGVDYASIASTVHFEPGESVVSLTVTPYKDDVVEQDEVVEVSLLGTELYTLGYDTSATLLIRDLQPVVGVEVLQARGSVSPSIPAAFLVTRNGQTANSLFVRLKLGGKAVNGVDYSYVPPYVSFAAGETSMPIEICPLSTSSLSSDAQSVTLEVVTQTAYALSDISAASVVLVDYLDSLDAWQSRVAPGSPSDPLDFAVQDSGVFGLDYLQCYAYGIDPQNPEAAKLPQLSFRNGHFNVDVHQNPAAMDLQFVVEGSPDLENWSSGMVRPVTVPELLDQAGLVTYEAVPAAGSEPTFFLRVRVIHNN